MINKIFLTGYVGDKVFEKTTRGGKRMLNFMLRQSYKYSKDGQWTNGERFHKVVSFDDNLHIGPGDFVFVEGTLTTTKDRDGQFSPQITANSAEIISQNSANKVPRVTDNNRYENEDLF